MEIRSHVYGNAAKWNRVLMYIAIHQSGNKVPVYIAIQQSGNKVPVYIAMQQSGIGS